MPSTSEVDHLVLQAASKKLRDALHLPSTNPHLSNWLFSNKAHPFHPHDTLLPPDAFNSALALHISHIFTDFHPHANVFASPFPTHVYFGSDTLQPPPPQNISHGSLHIILVPARIIDGVLVGYTLSLRSSVDMHLFPFEGPFPLSARLQGRFLFDFAKRQMLCYISHLNHAVSGIISMHWLENNRRERLFFTVPNLVYSHNNLPTRVLALLKNLEYKVESVPHTQFPQPPNPPHPHQQQPLSKPNLASWSSTFLSGLNSSPQTPNTNTPQPNPVLLQLPPPSTTRPPQTSSCRIFDMSAMTRSLAEMESLIEGKFFAPRLSRDVMDPNTGEIISRRMGELRASLSASDPMSRQMLCDVAAQAYYTAALAVTTDRMLLFPTRDGKHRRMLANGDVGQCQREDCLEGKRAKVGESALLAPKPALPLCEHCLEGVRGVGPGSSEEEMRLEMKRRKNRLSAARSNLRRKERQVAQEKELGALKERVEVLRKVEERLRTENGSLKRGLGVGES